jgi:hypothetical protein
MTHRSLAKDLFEDMGRKVAEASAQPADEDGTKVVDEIESLCMNCHEDVCFRHAHYFIKMLTQVLAGNYTPPSYQDTFFPRNRYHVFRVPALRLQEC